MSEIEFEKPNFQIDREQVSDTEGTFSLSPLETGFGTTIGNALRRVLLSSLPGLAVYAIEVEGASHEYSPLDGVLEDLVQIVLNIKKLVLSDRSDNPDADYTLKLEVSGSKEVKAGYIVCPDMVEVVNKDLTICHLSENGHIKITLHAHKGRGLVLAEENKDPSWPLGWIAVDSNFSPVLNVKIAVEPARFGHDTSYEKLTMTVTTDGSMIPSDAIALASRILIEHLQLFEGLSDEVKSVNIMSSRPEKSNKSVATINLEDLDLSVRSYNCLKRNGLKTVQDLCNLQENQLMAVRNLGKKCYKEIVDKLAAMGLSLQHDGIKK